MSGKSTNPFAILGIDANSTEEEVRRAYRTLSLRHHPDKAGAGSTARFQEINHAYQMIMDQRLCGHNRWQETQRRSQRSDRQTDLSTTQTSPRPSHRQDEPEERPWWRPQSPSPEPPQPRRGTRRTRTHTDRNHSEARHGFYDADREVPPGSRAQRRGSNFGEQEHRRPRYETREPSSASRGFYDGNHEHRRPRYETRQPPSASRGFYDASREEPQSQLRRHTRRASQNPGFVPHRPRTPPPQGRHPNDHRPSQARQPGHSNNNDNNQRDLADTFDSISQRLLYGLHVERQRQTQAGNRSLHLETDVGRAIADLMRNQNTRDSRDLANDVGRIMFLLRRLHLQSDARWNGAVDASVDDFVAMARSLGILGFLDPDIFSHAVAAFRARFTSRRDEDCRGR